MKLVEILARELKEWPKYGCVAVTQDFDHDVLYWAKSDINCKNGVWVHSSGNGLCLEIYAMDSSPTMLATDHATAIVTRADWEAERAKLKDDQAVDSLAEERAKLKAPKANGDGWIRHRGGKCPVEAGVLVDIKARDGQVWKAQDPVKQCEWRHDGDGLDIMRYRIHKPADQVEQVSDTFSQVNAPEPILTIRDRIYELDSMRAEVESTYQRQISEITQERESLVKKLAGEGLALVESVAQPVEDMSDWRNWKVGDLVQYVGLNDTRYYTSGSKYKICCFDIKSEESGPVFDDNTGNEDHHWGYDDDLTDNFKWHSRPAS